MPVIIKSPEEIERIARAGAVVSKVLDELTRLARPGVTTHELDAHAEQALRAVDAKLILKGYVAGSSPPYPACTCLAINDEVVHAIPGQRALQTGDLLTIDLAASVDGWCADVARTLAMPGASAAAEALAATTRHAVVEAIGLVRPGVAWSSIASAVSKSVKAHGFALVRGYDGHGIGRKLHESPRAWLHDSAPSDRIAADFILWPGMVLTIEPVVVAGKPEVRTRPDGWTVQTLDGSWAAHEERTIAVVNGACRVLAG